MKNLMYEVTCSDIRITELKLKRIKLCKEQLLKNKPSLFNNKNIKIWQTKLNKLKEEEDNTIKELQEIYNDLAKFL